MRALASATIVFSAGFIGTVLGPLMTGIVSDALTSQLGLPNGIRYAIFSSSGVGILGAVLLMRGARYLPEEFAVARANR